MRSSIVMDENVLFSFFFAIYSLNYVKSANFSMPTRMLSRLSCDVGGVWMSSTLHGERVFLISRFLDIAFLMSNHFKQERKGEVSQRESSSLLYKELSK